MKILKKLYSFLIIVDKRSGPGGAGKEYERFEKLFVTKISTSGIITSIKLAS